MPESGAVSRIRTGCSAPRLYVPRKTGTFPPTPPPPCDESETQAAIPRTVAAAMKVRVRSFILGNRLLQRFSHSLESACQILVAVCGGHKARFKRRWRQINPSLESRVEELSKEIHIRSLGHGEIAHRLGAEEKPPHRSRAVRGQRNAEVMSDQ